jgi:hypothetical protein
MHLTRSSTKTFNFAIMIDTFTVKKTIETQENNMWPLEHSVIHVGRAAQSMWMTDFSDLSTWMTEFSVTRALCSCIPLGVL